MAHAGIGGGSDGLTASNAKPGGRGGGRGRGRGGRGRGLPDSVSKPGSVNGRGRGGVCDRVKPAKQANAAEQSRTSESPKKQQLQRQPMKAAQHREPQTRLQPNASSAVKAVIQRPTHAPAAHSDEWRKSNSPAAARDSGSGQPSGCPTCGGSWLQQPRGGSYISGLSQEDWAFLRQLADKLEQDRLDRLTHQRKWERYAGLKVDRQATSEYDTELSSDEEDRWGSQPAKRRKIPQHGAGASKSKQPQGIQPAEEHPAAPQSPPPAAGTAHRKAPLAHVNT